MRYVAAIEDHKRLTGLIVFSWADCGPFKIVLDAAYYIPIAMGTVSSPLEASFLAAQSQKLEEEKKNLEAELQRIARKDPKGDDYHAIVEQVGRAQDDNVSEEEQYEAARSVEQSLEVKLRDVNSALVRIEAGRYGLCVRCGNPIERQRLEALPSAGTCRTHASDSVTRP